MFDFLKRGQAPSSKQIDKVVKRLTEPQGEDAPRIEAAEKLAEWGTPDALYALLKRFTMSSKVMEQDVEEAGLWFIVFEVCMASVDVPDYVAARRPWFEAWMQAYPSPRMHSFVLSLETAKA